MFTVDRMTQAEFELAIANLLFRRISYGAGRDYIESLTGEEKNACAAVHSSVQILRGVFESIYSNTAQVEEACGRAGMDRFDDWRDIQIGDTLFAEDENHNGLPDHVYLAAGKPDETGHLLVFDNYGANLYRRNLKVGGKYTPFMFGMRLSEKEGLPLRGMPAHLAKSGFRFLYSKFVWVKLPSGVQRRINRIRSHHVFSKL